MTQSIEHVGPRWSDPSCVLPDPSALSPRRSRDLASSSRQVRVVGRPVRFRPDHSPCVPGPKYGSRSSRSTSEIGQSCRQRHGSSWEGIRDWNVPIRRPPPPAVPRVREVLSADVALGRPLSQLIAAHEPKSYSDAYPITSNWWLIPGGNCSRAAELVLANRERTHVPPVPPRGPCVSVTPPLPPNPAP